MILTWFAICLERAPESQHQPCLECNCLNFYHSDTSSCSEYDKHWIMHGHCTVFVIVKTSTHILCLKWTLDQPKIPKRSGNFDWRKVNGTRLFGSSQWKFFPPPPPFPRSRAHIWACLSLNALYLLYESLEPAKQVQSSYLGHNVPSI